MGEKSIKTKLKSVKPFCLWFTGLPSSGKTTLAKALKKELEKDGMKIVHLDGDILREGLCSDLGFSKEDREENNRRVIFVAQLLVKNQIPVVVSFISPYRKTRDFAKRTIPNTIEVYIKCPIKECQKRDVKGLYAKAARGEIKNMTGVDDPYEEPDNPELVIETHKIKLNKAVSIIIRYLQKLDFIK